MKVEEAYELVEEQAEDGRLGSFKQGFLFAFLRQKPENYKQDCQEIRADLTEKYGKPVYYRVRSGSGINPPEHLNIHAR